MAKPKFVLLNQLRAKFTIDFSWILILRLNLTSNLKFEFDIHDRIQIFFELDSKLIWAYFNAKSKNQFSS